MEKQRLEAAQQFKVVVDQILAGDVPLPRILKRALDACVQADWPEFQEWVLGELNGFHGRDPEVIPWYRRIARRDLYPTVTALHTN